MTREHERRLPEGEAASTEALTGGLVHRVQRPTDRAAAAVAAGADRWAVERLRRDDVRQLDPVTGRGVLVVPVLELEAGR